MSLTILAFIAAMLAVGFFGNTLLSVSLGVIAVTFCFMQKGKEKEHERMRGISLILAIAAMIASTAFGALSIYNTIQAINAENAAYQQQMEYYNQIYGTGTDSEGTDETDETDDGGYVVEPDGTDANAEASDETEGEPEAVTDADSGDKVE